MQKLLTGIAKLLSVLVISGGVAVTMVAGFVGLTSTSVAMAGPPDAKAQTDSNADGREQPQAKEKAQPPVAAVAADAANAPTAEKARKKGKQAPSENIKGRVIGYDRKAVADAKLWWYRTRVHDIDPMKPTLLAESDKEGRFSFAPPTIPDPETERASWDYYERIAVVAPGYGFRIIAAQSLKRTKPESVFGAIATAIVSGTGAEPVGLPSEGKPLRGRIVTIEGKPVVGATVRIRNHSSRTESHFERSDLETRDSKNVEWRSWVSHLLAVIEPVSERFALPSATTEADGKFELTSLPEDCLFQLLLQGEGIQSTDIVAHNVDGEKVIVESGRQSTTPPATVYRNDFLFVVGPSQPVIGRVTDLDTGEPVSNAVVRAFAVHGEAVHSTRERQHFATRTDKEGRYRISGLPMGDDNRLAAFTTDDVAYFPDGQEADTSTPNAVVEVNFRLKRAVWVNGRVKDGVTGKPFTGDLTYFWFRDQSLEKAIPGLRNYDADGLYSTNVHGQFRIPVLATRGILCYQWDGNPFEQPNPIDKFPRGLGAEQIEGKDNQMQAFPTMPHYLLPGGYNFVTEINPPAGTEQVEVEMVLYPSKPVRLKFVAENDEKLPTSGYRVHGLNERWGWQVDQTTEPVVEDLFPKQTRKVFVFHRDAGLAGGVLIDENSKQPVEIKLTKSGGVKGRLLDENADVIRNGVVNVDYAKLKSNEPYAIWANHPKLRANPSQIPVDEEGRFQLDGLIPGWKYSAWVSAPRKMDSRMMSVGIGAAFADVEIKPGETRDLGDVVVGYPKDKAKDDTPKR